jgi:hypothetical protein
VGSHETAEASSDGQRGVELRTAWGGSLTCSGTMRTSLGELQRRWVPDENMARRRA